VKNVVLKRKIEKTYIKRGFEGIILKNIDR
jgi:hypothetical protein